MPLLVQDVLHVSLCKLFVVTMPVVSTVIPILSDLDNEASPFMKNAIVGEYSNIVRPDAACMAMVRWLGNWSSSLQLTSPFFSYSKLRIYLLGKD